MDSTSTLEELIQAASLNNPGLKAAYHQWQGALAQVALAGALPDPRLSYGYFIRQVETRVGPQRQRLGISQMFPGFGKRRLKSTAAGQEALAAQAAFEAKRQTLIFEVKSAWWEYAYLIRAAGIVGENIALLGNVAAVLQSTYRTGNTAYTELIKVQIEQEKLTDRLRDLQEMQRPARARLNAALNRPPQGGLPRPALPAPEEQTTPDSVLHRQLQERNPDLLAANFRIEKAQTSLSLARKSSLPDLTLGMDFIDTGEALNPATAESGKDPVMATVSINIPLWFGKNRAAVDLARAQVQAAGAQHRFRENSLATRLEKVLFETREANRRIVLYRDNLIPRTQQALSVVRSAFQAGEAGFVEMVDLQRSLLEFQLTLARETVTLSQKQAELDLLTGNTPAWESENHE
ncbi:MAG: TolC family protein [Calditrichaeota bacterium]|nr:TolC family protein [Calditrichota bacterium]